MNPSSPAISIWGYFVAPPCLSCFFRSSSSLCCICPDHTSIGSPSLCSQLVQYVSSNTLISDPVFLSFTTHVSLNILMLIPALRPDKKCWGLILGWQPVVKKRSSSYEMNRYLHFKKQLCTKDRDKWLRLTVFIFKSMLLCPAKKRMRLYYFLLSNYDYLCHIWSAFVWFLRSSRSWCEREGNIFSFKDPTQFRKSTYVDFIFYKVLHPTLWIVYLY